MVHRRKPVLQILLFSLLISTAVGQTAPAIWHHLQQQFFRTPETKLVLHSQTGHKLTLYYQHPYRFRMYLNGIRIYSDGETLWLYQPEQNKVIIAQATPRLNTPILTLLLDTTRHPKQLRLLRAHSSENPTIRWMLHATFPEGTGAIQRVEFALTQQYHPQSVTVHYANGMTERWTVKELHPLHPHPPSFFTPTLPDSVETIDLRPSTRSPKSP